MKFMVYVAHTEFLRQLIIPLQSEAEMLLQNQLWKKIGVD